MNVFRSLTFSVAFYGKVASFSNFGKIQEFFGKTHLIFFRRKASFWLFWELLLIPSHSGVNLLPVEFFKNWFFSKNPSFFEQKPEFSILLRNPTYSVAFYRKVASFSDFKNTLDIFWKNAAFCKKPKFWKF